jgi:hypothetical protein
MNSIDLVNEMKLKALGKRSSFASVEVYGMARSHAALNRGLHGLTAPEYVSCQLHDSEGLNGLDVPWLAGPRSTSAATSSSLLHCRPKSKGSWHVAELVLSTKNNRGVCGL